MVRIKYENIAPGTEFNTHSVLRLSMQLLCYNIPLKDMQQKRGCTAY